MSEPSPTPAVIRRVHLADAQAMHEFLLRLSRASRHSRFHGAVNDVSPSFLRRLVSADGESHAAWVACVWGADGEEIVGEGVWSVVALEHDNAEFAISVRDDWQGRGVADALMRALVDGARQCGLRQIYGDVMQSNARMLAFLGKHGMSEQYSEPGPEPGVARIGCMFDRTSASATQPSWLARLKSARSRASRQRTS